MTKQRGMLGDALRLAVGTLTAVPVGSPSHVDRRMAGTAMVLSPLAVLPLAALVGAVLLVGQALGLPALMMGFAAVGALALGNRALHLDGLSDVADGLTASYNRERSLEVMRGGAAGPAGVVAVVIVLGIQAVGFATLASWTSPFGAVVAGLAVCASRAALCLCCTRGVPPAREAGLGRTYSRTVPIPVTAAVWSVVALALAAASQWVGQGWWRGMLAAVVALVVVTAAIRRAVRRFGGVTGDLFGAAIELALAAILVALS